MSVSEGTTRSLVSWTQSASRGVEKSTLYKRAALNLPRPIGREHHNERKVCEGLLALDELRGDFNGARA